jgi:hypothetical protein
MMKYNIEGGIDFYEELYNSLDIDEDNNKTEDDKNLCLITNKPLCDKFVEMVCGHKFNYIPLYLDIKNHKQKYNGMEGSSSRLNANEIRCPYCRKRQQGVLPYYEELGLEKIIGVNLFDIKHQNPSSQYKKCEFLKINPNFDPSGNNVMETSEYNNGNCKFHKCYQSGSQIGHNYGLQEEIENYGDSKSYCWTHKKLVIKQYKKSIADKAKEEIKNAKLLAKEEEKKKAIEEKQKAKEEKQKAKKANKTKFISENIVLGPVNITDISGNNIVEGCNEILKNGINKGKPCGCKLFQDNICKRHYSIKNKIIVISLI